MKVRDGFVTNSSSTNFLIISKEELTANYLYTKLGFKEESILKEAALEFCYDIVDATSGGLRWFDIEELNYESILEIFGEKSAKKFKKLEKEGFKSYAGYTSSDSNYLTSYFTMDNFEINEKDFYLNGLNSAW